MRISDWSSDVCSSDLSIDVAVYAHGGLTDEEAAAKTARIWIPLLYSNRIFPVFLMWETGARKTIANMFEDVTRGEAELAGGPRWERFKQRFDDWKNERLEGLARPLGRKLWGEMKQNADALSAARASGAIQLFEQFRAVKSDRSEEHTSELQSLMRNSYAVCRLEKKKTPITHRH